MKTPSENNNQRNQEMATHFREITLQRLLKRDIPAGTHVQKIEIERACELFGVSLAAISVRPKKSGLGFDNTVIVGAEDISVLDAMLEGKP